MVAVVWALKFGVGASVGTPNCKFEKVTALIHPPHLELLVQKLI